MNRGNLTPYLVEVKETYIHDIIVYAEDKEEAEMMAGELCYEGVIDIGGEPSCLDDRTIISERKASRPELDAKMYDEYDHSDLEE